MRWLRRSRRGQATAIGAVLFFVVSVVMVNFLYEVFMTQTEMNQFDAQRAQEKFEIDEVVFGALNTYRKNASSYGNITITTGTTANNTFVPGVVSVNTTGTSYPILNMNFTAGYTGWFFTKSYYGTGSGSMGAAGFHSTDSIGSPSGPGSVYSDFAYNPPSGKLAGAVMNWTARFFVDTTKLGTVTKTVLSIGKKCTTFVGVDGSRAYLKVYLNETLVYNEDITGADTSWSQVHRVISSPPWSTGWYSLILNLDVTLRHLGTGPPELKIYYDDVGIQIQTSSHVTDWKALFYIYSTKTTTRDLNLDVTTHYQTSQPIEQQVYIKDVARGSWVLLGKATMSTSSATLSYSIEGSAVQDYISDDRKVEVRVYTVHTANFSCVADDLTLTALAVGVGGQNQIIITFENTGGVEVRLVSLWIIGSSGHTQKGFDLRVSPASKKTYVANYDWSTGKYTFKVISDKGNMAVLTTTTG